MTGRSEGLFEGTRLSVGRQAYELAGGKDAAVTLTSNAGAMARRIPTIFDWQVADGEPFGRPHGDVGGFRRLTGELLAAWGLHNTKASFERLTRDEWSWVADQVRAKVLAAHAAAEGAVTPDQARLDAAARQRAQDARAAELRRQREALDAELAALDETPTTAVIPTPVETRRGRFNRSTP